MAIREIKRKNGIVYIAYFKFQGKQYQKTFYSKKDAKSWEELEKRRLKNQIVTPQGMMYSHACRLYLRDCEVRMAANTYDEKLRHLREFGCFLSEADVDMEDINTAIARKFLLEIQKTHRNKAANRRLRTMKALWNWHKDTVQRNPWRGIPPFAEETYHKYVPKPDDMGKVLAVAEPWQANLLNALLLTGARAGEILNLRWKDVFEKSVQLWTRKRRNGSLESRSIPLVNRLQSILDSQRSITNEKDYVFINPNTDAPYTMRQPVIRYMLKRLCKKANVKEFGFHAIRHYFAVSLMKSQAGLIDIQMLLGHQRATTTDIYLRGMLPPLDHLADIIESAVQPSAPCEKSEGVAN